MTGNLLLHLHSGPDTVFFWCCWRDGGEGEQKDDDDGGEEVDDNEEVNRLLIKIFWSRMRVGQDFILIIA